MLFAEEFNQGIPGWTSVKPRAIYWGGPLRWEYDLVKRAIVERSDIYTDSAAFSTSAIAPMLINGTVAAAPFTYSARLTAGDDDGFGLIFGYQNESNFYRVGFARQARSGFPFRGWTVDRKTNGTTRAVAGPSTGFVPVSARPFDVTLSVDALDRLSLTVVDDPAGAATPHLLVDRQPLPTAADGRVGVFTWGMSGASPPGFLIQNLALEPAPLQGNLEGFMPWTAVVPPRADGSTALVGGLAEAHWFLKAEPCDTLEEDSDSGAGWDPAGRVDFTGPTLVADLSWGSNYAAAVRILPHDAHGHGMVLRYQNPSNFYRIALRQTHSSGWGMRPGLSVQKNINGVYTELFSEFPVRFSPAPEIPYDLVAQIATNTLRILVVADPDGAAQVHTYGPFTLHGLDHGKIGLFSWLMSRVEFDRVSVHDGASLYVSSPFGSPSPGRGLSSFAAGQRVEATASVSTNPPGVRRTVTGWTGAGSVPAAGTGTNVSFVIDSFSRLHWQWKTEFQVSVTGNPGGTVTAPAGEWFTAGTNLSIIARPDRGFMFDGWEGDLQSRSPTLDLAVNQPFDLSAYFTPDSDEDGLPDEWELAYWGDLSRGPKDDPDEDGNPDLQEMEQGTDPNSADILHIGDIRSENHAPRLTVWNNTGTRYDVQRCSTLNDGWTTISSNQPANTATAALPPGVSFLRLVQPAHPVSVPPFRPGSWTLAVLPDTQNYATNYPDLFEDQTRWIVANKDRYNIRYVLHVGDLVDTDNTGQWARAHAAMSILDGEVPYALAPGNHDYSAFWPARSTRINAYFPPSRFQSWPTFGGVKDAGRIENSYHLFSANGADWLILALEFGPRNATVAWANAILDQYPDRRAILVTHAFLYSDNTRYDWAAKGAAQPFNPHSYPADYDPDGTNDGEELWQKLLKGRSNAVLVVNGHVVSGGVGRLTSPGEAGNHVHQLLANYQTEPMGGGAFLRLLEFRPSGKKVQVKTFSPFSGTFKTDGNNQFILNLAPPLPHAPPDAAGPDRRRPAE